MSKPKLSERINKALSCWEDQSPHVLLALNLWATEAAAIEERCTTLKEDLADAESKLVEVQIDRGGLREYVRALEAEVKRLRDAMKGAQMLAAIATVTSGQQSSV